MTEESQVISLRAVTPQNFNDITKLQVREDQKGFVASNIFSLAEAYVYPGLNPMAIYAGERPVGFLMYGFWDERQQYWISRLMIAADHQGRGYGREAMRLMVERMRTIPDCRQIYISYEPSNQTARTLYTSMGFVITGEMVDGEEVACLDVSRI